MLPSHSLFTISFNMQKLIYKLLLLSLIVVSGSLVVDTVYRKLVDDDYPQPVIWFERPIEPKYDFVVLGNSHSQSGITLEGVNRNGLILNGVAQRFDFDLALLKQHHTQIAAGAVVIIPVTPISFSHKKTHQGDGLQGMYYSQIAPFLIPYLNIGNYVQARITPFFRSGYLLREWHATNVRDKVAAQEKWIESTPEPTPAPMLESTVVSLPTPTQELVPLLETSPFSVGHIMRQLGTMDPADVNKHDENIHFVYNKWLHTEEFGQEYFEHNRLMLEKVISYAKAQGWRPVLITIPLSAELVEALPDDYMQVYLYDNLTKTNLQGVEHLDFSDYAAVSANNRFFVNADHLNENGAIVFSYHLLQELISQGYLPKTADGYYYSSPQ